MGSLDLLNHIFNFLAPAVVAGFVVAILAPIWFKKNRSGPGMLVQGLMNALSGAFALACGLWIFGNDGKMATYAAMVMLVASCQWVGARAWR
jgi:hypothetical protein